jgi:hypothetical protein
MKANLVIIEIFFELNGNTIHGALLSETIVQFRKTTYALQ